MDDDGIKFGTKTYAPTEGDLLPPVEPTKIVCVGLNYANHAEEENMDLPNRPMLFLKPPNTVSGQGDAIPIPPGKETVEYEAEIGVVIDRQCRDVSESNAPDVIEGFTCLNDVSNRDDQRIEQNWIREKAFDNAAPIGPVVATPDEVPDDADIELRVNGERQQDSSRDQFIFSVEELIAEITSYMTLEPGDIISTGTPAGVGPISDGDTVEAAVEGVGVLKNEFTRQ